MHSLVRSRAIRDKLDAPHACLVSIHGAKHSPPAGRGAPDCPSAHMRTSDFRVIFGAFGTDFESQMMPYGMKLNNSPRKLCPKKILSALGFIMVTRGHV